MAAAEPDFDSDVKELRQRISRGEGVVIECEGSSMRPVVNDGDRIEIVQNLAPRRFDLVVFPHEGNLVCHYVTHVNNTRVASGERLLITRGTANLYEDPIPVPESAILGSPRGIRLSFFRRLVDSLRHARDSRHD